MCLDTGEMSEASNLPGHLFSICKLRRGANLLAFPPGIVNRASPNKTNCRKTLLLLQLPSFAPSFVP